MAQNGLKYSQRYRFHEGLSQIEIMCVGWNTIHEMDIVKFQVYTL